MITLIAIRPPQVLASIVLTAIIATPPSFAQNGPAFGPIKVKTIPFHVEAQDDSTPGHDWRQPPTPVAASTSVPPLTWTSLPPIKVHTLRCYPPTGKSMFPFEPSADGGIPKR